MFVRNSSDAKKLLNNNFPVIFLFHGVIGNRFKYQIRNYNKKHITVSKFSKYIKTLTTYGTPISLDEICQKVRNKIIFPKKSFCITFDDGFYNNYKFALPILKKYKVPHIIYLTSNYVDKNLISWVDRIDIAATRYKKSFFSSLILKKKFDLRGRKKKILFLEYVRKFAKKQKNIDLNNFSETVINEMQCKVPRKSKSIIDRKLNWKEINLMKSNSITSFGGHSHNHNILGHLSKKDSIKEIVNSVKIIKKRTNMQIKHYSYPEGFCGSFNQHIINCLKKNKIDTAVTTLSKYNNYKTNLFKLNRIFLI